METHDQVHSFLLEGINNVQNKLIDLDKKVEIKFEFLTQKLEKIESLKERVDVLDHRFNYVKESVDCLQKEFISGLKNTSSDHKETLREETKFKRDLLLLTLTVLGTGIINVLIFLLRK